METFIACTILFCTPRVAVVQSILFGYIWMALNTLEEFSAKHTNNLGWYTGWKKYYFYTPTMTYNVCHCYSWCSLSDVAGTVYLSQSESGSKCRLQLWTMYVSCKTVLEERTPVELPADVDITSGCWTPSGWFVFCDSSMNVFQTRPSDPVPKMNIKYNAEHTEQLFSLVCPTKQGFVLHMPDSLTVAGDSKTITRQ